MTKPTTNEHDAAAPRTLWAIAIVGVLVTLGGLVLAGGHTALGIGVGSAVAVANFWALTLVVQKLLTAKRGGAPWGLLAAAKFVVLIGGLYLLLKSGWVDLLPLLVGYGALPVGIVSAQLGAPREVGEEG